jgi:hypothetical protein
MTFEPWTWPVVRRRLFWSALAVVLPAAAVVVAIPFVDAIRARGYGLHHVLWVAIAAEFVAAIYLFGVGGLSRYTPAVATTEPAADVQPPAQALRPPAADRAAGADA